MPIHDHEPSLRGRAFLWGGVALGLLFLLALFTRGFGLLGRSGAGGQAAELMLRQGDKIIVPEGSALRSRLTVMAAALQPISAKLVLPALGGRVLELKVALGERVARGQVLAVIDSPDLAQAYDDNDKAADALRLAEKTLTR